MSTYWTLRVVGRLKAGIPEDIRRDLQDIISTAIERTSPEAIDNISVCFGPGTIFDNKHLTSAPGAANQKGFLRVFAQADNLERESEEDDNGIAPVMTRGERILAVLDRVLEGPIGEVVGCIASENDDYDHGHPLVRCADGRIRIIVTEPAIDWEHPDRRPDHEPVPVPPVLDVASLRQDLHNWTVSLPELIARYSIEGVSKDVRTIG